MSKFTIKIHATLVRQGLEDLNADIPKVGRQRIYLRMLRIKTRLSQPAPKPDHPIQWESEKQKRAFFATDGFGGGIPTRRTGRNIRGWNLIKLEDGYSLKNEEKGAFFIWGDLFKRKSQSRIHAGRWPQSKIVTFEELDQLPEAIAADIEAAKKRAGL